MRSRRRVSYEINFYWRIEYSICLLVVSDKEIYPGVRRHQNEVFTRGVIMQGRGRDGQQRSRRESEGVDAAARRLAYDDDPDKHNWQENEDVRPRKSR